MDLKKVLIISPYFPPSNAADMQRIRMSLPYFREFGWEAEVVIVDQQYSEMLKDDLLLKSIPPGIRIHVVKPLNKKWTSRLGLGSLGLRSLGSYRQTVNNLLKTKSFDLIYFSTTQFPVCILGAYWKERYQVPYIIDMQDPWHSEYYRDKPKEQRPKKYWFSYRLNKYLEPIAIKRAGGLISVSDDYIADLKIRYPVIAGIPAQTITFGAFEPDLKIAEGHRHRFASLLNPDFINIVYIGRGGADMGKATAILFDSLKQGLEKEPQLFNKLKLYFIGTSYAPAGQGKASFLPLAKRFGLENMVTEITDRISYFHTLVTLQQADVLFVPGSDDPKYTASKIYPYLLTRKPLLAIFNEKSSVVKIINESTEYATMLTFDETGNFQAGALYGILSGFAHGLSRPVKLLDNFKNYSAETLTGRQVELFNKVIRAS
jgi:hypothetical protein